MIYYSIEKNNLNKFILLFLIIIHRYIQIFSPVPFVAPPPPPLRLIHFLIPLLVLFFMCSSSFSPPFFCSFFVPLISLVPCDLFFIISHFVFDLMCIYSILFQFIQLLFSSIKLKFTFYSPLSYFVNFMYRIILFVYLLPIALLPLVFFLFVFVCSCVFRIF